MAKTKKFNPMGKGYDMETARKSGMTPVMGEDGKPHWGSRDPKSGKILKGRRHKTFSKEQIASELRDYNISYSDGRYKSTKKPRNRDMLKGSGPPTSKGKKK
jgi:hypothetical protein